MQKPNGTMCAWAACNKKFTQAKRGSAPEMSERIWSNSLTLTRLPWVNSLMQALICVNSTLSDMNTCFELSSSAQNIPLLTYSTLFRIHIHLHNLFIPTNPTIQLRLPDIFLRSAQLRERAIQVFPQRFAESRL